MIYDYSYMAVVDGSTGEMMWTFNSSQAVMTSAITILSKKRGQDGMVFIAMGQSRQQAGARRSREVERQSACARNLVEEERKTCDARERQKRHSEDAEGSSADLFPHREHDISV